MVDAGPPPQAKRVLRYGDVAIGVESLTPTAAARRLRAGRAAIGRAVAGGASFVPPDRVFPVRQTTEREGRHFLASQASWPELVVAATLNEPGRLAPLLRDPAHAPGAPYYPTLAAAVADVLYGMPADGIFNLQTPHVLVRVPDRRGRLLDLQFRDTSVVATCESARDGDQKLTLRWAWRNPHGWDSRDDPLSGGSERRELRVARVPVELDVALVDDEGALLDRRGWSGVDAVPREAAPLEESVAQWIRGGESGTVEFKQQLGGPVNTSFAETVCAFANGPGGVILVGVADDGTPVGYAPDKAADRITSIVRDALSEPVAVQIDQVACDCRPVQVVRVAPVMAKRRPVRVGGRIMVRVNATTREATTDEIRALAAPDVSPVAWPTGR